MQKTAGGKFSGKPKKFPKNPLAGGKKGTWLQSDVVFVPFLLNNFQCGIQSPDVNDYVPQGILIV